MIWFQKEENREGRNGVMFFRVLHLKQGEGTRGVWGPYVGLYVQMPISFLRFRGLNDLLLEIH